VGGGGGIGSDDGAVCHAAASGAALVSVRVTIHSASDSRPRKVLVGPARELRRMALSRAGQRAVRPGCHRPFPALVERSLTREAGVSGISRFCERHGEYMSGDTGGANPQHRMRPGQLRARRHECNRETVISLAANRLDRGGADPRLGGEPFHEATYPLHRR
jgi:hypothetical protein